MRAPACGLNGFKGAQKPPGFCAPRGQPVGRNGIAPNLTLAIVRGSSVHGDCAQELGELNTVERRLRTQEVSAHERSMGCSQERISRSGETVKAATKKSKRKLSAAGRQRIIDATKKRWAAGRAAVVKLGK